MISGNDVKLSELETLRKAYNGLIYCDIHELSKGRDENNKRILRLIPEYKRWLSVFDILQANEFELTSLSVADTEIGRVKEIFSYGLKIIIVTKGESGVTVYYLSEGKIENIFVAAERVNSINNVGCGDIFGSLFFHNYIKSKEIKSSVELANKAAAIITTYGSYKDFRKLNNDLYK